MQRKSQANTYDHFLPARYLRQCQPCFIPDLNLKSVYDLSCIGLAELAELSVKLILDSIAITLNQLTRKATRMQNIIKRLQPSQITVPVHIPFLINFRNLNMLLIQSYLRLQSSYRCFESTDFARGIRM